MANITIYVPYELKKAMDKAKNINWSRIAQDAFAARLKLKRTKKQPQFTHVHGDAYEHQ